MDAHALYELICSRRSCRAYTGTQVPQKLLEQVLAAGQMAPSGKNLQQCHFLVLRNPSHLAELRQMVTRLFAEMTNQANISVAASIQAAQKGPYDFFYSAPTLIVVANRLGNPNNLADSAVAVSNMMLMATALGLGSCFINQLRWLKESEEMRRFLIPLGLGEEETVYGGMALGWAKNPPGPPQPRTGNTYEIIE